MTVDKTGVNWQNDRVLPEFDAATIELGIADDGPMVATLLRRFADDGCNRAVLYIHGFIDYFFQSHVAEEFVSRGWNFYALDLRRYGRSLREGQRPNYVTDLFDYDVEIGEAIRIIRDDDEHSEIVLLGHSTGGLIASLYAHRGAMRDDISAVILNSPFFAFAVPSHRKALLPIAGAVGAFAPWLYDKHPISPIYGRSLLSEFHGEWKYDRRWKPLDGFPAYYGWIRAVRAAQDVASEGLNIKCPILVMHSEHSGQASGEWRDEFLTRDIVLDVSDMKRVGPRLGVDVTLAGVSGGIHDLFLSAPEVRRAAIDLMMKWLDQKVGTKSQTSTPHSE